MVARHSPWLYQRLARLYPYATAVLGLMHGRRGSLEHLKSTWSLLFKASRILGTPMNITIEPTNLCNLRCPVCETGAGELGRAGSNMSFIDFKRIIDKVALQTNTLMFYFMGEPFLNKQAYEMIRYAKDLGVPFVTTCTNGDFVDPEKLVACGLDEISFQVGGMTQETHGVYRVNSRLERVLSNLEETLRLRQEKGVSMRVVCGFILMRHNEHEVETFKKRMATLGVDEAIVVEPCVRTVAQGKEYLPHDQTRWIYDPVGFAQGRLAPKYLPNNKCPWIYYSLTILVNGDVVPCCRDPKGEEVMGNLLVQNVDEVWNGSRYRDFRARINNDQGHVNICRLCSSYPASKVA